MLFLSLLLLTCCPTNGHAPPTVENGTISDTDKYFAITEKLEEHFKGALKGALKPLMPSLVQLNEVKDVSGTCVGALLLYLAGLNKAKMWAVRMLDATSKLPPGVLQGTFADYGSFDECLNVKGPRFIGQSCALEIRPPQPPLSPDFTLVNAYLDGNNGTLSGYFKVAHEALYHKKLRLVACIPSSCSLQDARAIAKKVSDTTDFFVEVPQCYVKEEKPLQVVHWTLLISLVLLLVLCIMGPILEFLSPSKKTSNFRRFLEAFSLSSNGSRLFSAPGGNSTEFACVHGVRALSMFWVVLGHTYVLMDFELLKDPTGIQSWFRSLEFEFLHNGWLSVETFFLISGLLMTVGGLKFLKKTKGCFNVPLMTLRRYLRLAPSLLLLMGLVFFLPLLSSGPFWYQHVDPQVKSCANYWWASLLFISNWFGIDKGVSSIFHN
ncbi:nose resistant to fluoxetine protein 6 [Nephila pilipes]|uniref:Nose resistant to fluoxetine protein 6 n=1 Tax=Nephila pilipes TaxID=299642 RepID=A0A8X6N4Y7_NEPPI|nr:nose resistant to fluoxetine protein 6 [Nephila pilipes]